MKAAINTLEVALHNLETNEPIHRKEGNIEQADAEQISAIEIKYALRVLRAIMEPIHYLKPHVDPKM